MHLTPYVLAALGAMQAQAQVDAGPQPGDVDEQFPIVEQAPAQPGTGAATVQKAKPKPLAVAPVPHAADAQPDAAPAPGADSDAAKAAPDPAAIEPRVDDKAPTASSAAPALDKDGERAPDQAAPPPPAAAPADKIPDGIGFGGVPALNYDADNGFGFGVVATMFLYDGKTRPYRASITLQIFMTTDLVQDHNVVVDWLHVADLPLRLYTRVGYLQSLTQNYCGVGGAVTCDPRVAEAGAHAAGLTKKDDVDTFARNFYQRRFIDPYGQVEARWALVTEPARFELTAGYRGFYFIPGSWDDANKDKKPDLFPYPGSLYAIDHPDGEPGFDSALSAGFMLDTRDNEPAPTQGLWLEASARAASGLIGSTWNWAGANMTLRGYTPLLADHTLVWANRLVVDGVVGDPPVQELVRVGGSNDYYVYGGSEDGRGIRAQRYIGKLRVFDQNEVRWHFLDVSFLEQRFGFTTAGFVDLGVVGKEIDNPGPMDVLPGFGGALRLSWNENFIIRFDLGFSPIESYAPSLYILIGNPF